MITIYFDIYPFMHIFWLIFTVFLEISLKCDICFPALKQEPEHKSELSD